MRGVLVVNADTLSSQKIFKKVLNAFSGTTVVNSKTLALEEIKKRNYDAVIIGGIVLFCSNNFELALEIFKNTSKHPLVFIETKNAGLVRIPWEKLENNIQDEELIRLIKES
ncbi:MAG: hypothetical protein PHT40_01750 [Patescibacteria group bacterium]|nr:hypothetical protein [Patescibacteria group bacterium]